MLAVSHFAFDWFKGRYTLTIVAGTSKVNCPRDSQQDYCVLGQLCNSRRHRIATCGDLQ